MLPRQNKSATMDGQEAEISVTRVPRQRWRLSDRLPLAALSHLSLGASSFGPQIRCRMAGLGPQIQTVIKELAAGDCTEKDAAQSESALEKTIGSNYNNAC